MGKLEATSPGFSLRLGFLLFGHRTQEFPPKARDWMNTHSWIVSEIVVASFIAIAANSLLGWQRRPVAPPGQDVAVSVDQARHPPDH